MYDILGMSVAGEHSLYLGLPNTLGRKKTMALGFLKERIWCRVEGWSTKLPSRAGKEVLLKSVPQSLPSYAMSVFLLPKEIYQELEKKY